MKQVSIGNGKWLEAAAAASYKRMLADGMPTGGIASAGRTYAEQLRLWKLYIAGKGNLAARPGTSRHESGRALDITRKTAAQLWAVKGGDPMKRKSGEHIRANDYGWYRTVPTEAWHFAYDPTKDKKLKGTTSPTLRLGSKGAWVKALQKKLKVTADGFYGLKTMAAVKTAQKANGLKVDGIAGPVTLKKLGIKA